MRSAIVSVCVVLGACGGRTDDPTAADAASDTAASADTAAETTPPTCFDGTGTLVSIPYKVCTNDTDCLAKKHQTSCCGDMLWVGVEKTHERTFDGCEAASRAKFPSCRCAAGPTLTEDGKTYESATPPAVKCTNRTGSTGVCMTAAP